MSSNIQITKAIQRFAPLALPPLLVSESADEYGALLVALQKEIMPKGVVEQIYLEDIAAIIWEIQRLRRCKAGIVNSAYRAALESLLQRLLLSPDLLERITSESEAAELAAGWFVSKKCKKKVLALLDRYNLDESAIEAEAIRQSWSDLEAFERLLMVQRSRLDKALGCVADYRESYAVRMRHSSDRILADGDSISLQHVPSETN
jgi:hypothetical protein